MLREVPELMKLRLQAVAAAKLPRGNSYLGSSARQEAPCMLLSNEELHVMQNVTMH